MECFTVAKEIQMVAMKLLRCYGRLSGQWYNVVKGVLDGCLGVTKAL